MKHIRVYISILICLAGLTACLDSAAAKAAAAIDNVLSSATWQSDRWRDEVDGLIKTLNDINKSYGEQMSYIAGRAAGDAGIEFKCGVDFLRDRAKQDLLDLKNRILNKPTELPVPVVCHAEPAGISIESRPDFLYIYGYNFLVRDYITATSSYTDVRQIRPFLVYDGGEDDLEKWTDFPASGYQMTIKLATVPGAPDNIPLCNKNNRKIVFKDANNHQLGLSVGIARASCPVAPTPVPPSNEKVFLDIPVPFASSPFGFKEDRIYGDTCSTDYHRSNKSVYLSEKAGNAGCYFVEWIGDEKSCKLKVHLWADAFSGGKCEIKILESGDPKPQLPPPPCDCW